MNLSSDVSLRPQTYLRGQVWYWDDPIYRSKDRGKPIDLGVSDVRYSRYVVIVQVPDTMTTTGIYVAPCTSNSATPHGVHVPIQQSVGRTDTYVCCQGVHSAHPATLIQYICQLPEVAMQAIEAELIKCLIPSVTERLTKEDIKRWLGIDMNQTTEHLFTAEAVSQEKLAKKFCQEMVVQTGDPVDIVSVRKLKQAYDAWCIANMQTPTEDVIEFLKYMVYILARKTYEHILHRTPEGIIYDVTEFRGIQLRDIPKLVIPVTASKATEEGTASPRSINQGGGCSRIHNCKATHQLESRDEGGVNPNLRREGSTGMR